ncbi:hypothetical protein EDB85DRAFT_312861 [Lactarius pseudohatsudake]|nr:hypothetical protein EDB85DRAFT_312861 [Lactarius pseudohatsudake]
MAPSPPDSSAFLSPDFDLPRRACLNHQLRDGPDGLWDSMCRTSRRQFILELCKPMPFLTLWQSSLCLLAVVLLTPSLASRMATSCRESPLLIALSFLSFFFCLLVSYARQCHGEPGSNAKGDIVYSRMC